MNFARSSGDLIEIGNQLIGENTLSWSMTVDTEGLAPLEIVEWRKTAGREEDRNRSTVGTLEFDEAPKDRDAAAT